MANESHRLSGRVSLAALIALAIPAFAAAQHHAGGISFAPAPSGRTVVAASRSASAAPRAIARSQAGVTTTTRLGTPVARSGNGVRVIHRANNPFGFNGPDFQDVPGLGFDYPHLAAISGNRRLHNGRFAGNSPFGFGGFLFGPSVVVEEVPSADSQAVAPEEEIVADDPSDSPRPPRRPRMTQRASEPQAEAASAVQEDVQQYVFVRQDGSLVFAVAYAWENGTLRYITPDGIRRTMSRDSLDLNATQQFNEQRGLNFRLPA